MRGEIIIGGWTFEQSPENPDKTVVSYVIQANAKGLIPKAILNAGSKKLGFLPMKVNEAMYRVRKLK